MLVMGPDLNPLPWAKAVRSIQSGYLFKIVRQDFLPSGRAGENVFAVDCFVRLTFNYILSSSPILAPFALVVCTTLFFPFSIVDILANATEF